MTYFEDDGAPRDWGRDLFWFGFFVAAVVLCIPIPGCLGFH